MAEATPARFERLFYASPNAYLLLTPDLRIADQNGAHAAVTGFRREQLLGQHVFDIFPPNQNEPLRMLAASFERVRARGEPDTLPILHYPIPDPDSPENWLDRYWHVSNTPVEDAAGHLEYILCYVSDLTDIMDATGPSTAARLAEGVSSLDHERRRMRALVEQAPGFVAVGRGPDFVFELANRAYYQLVGHREVLGRPVREALPELEGQGFYELLDQVYQSGEPFVGRAMPIQFQQDPGGELVTRHIDFIYQPIFNGDDITGIFVQGHDVTEAHELSRELSHQAAHDTLTGLTNRREFEARLEDAIASLQEDSGVYALLYLDLDQFKLVNDTCGHDAGDEYLRLIAMVLQSRLHAGDILARLGGDEFGLLLTDCAERRAMVIAEELRRAVSDVEFVWDKRVFGGSVSIGLLDFDVPEVRSNNLLSAADSACFLAKEKGRNRVQVYREEDEELISRWREMDWAGRLQRALKEQRFELYGQRIAALGERNRAPHYEVLVRLRGEDGQLVPPMAFIPAAERYGLMPAVDRSVIDDAFACLAQCGDSVVSLSINLSGTTLNEESMAAFIEAALERHDINPSRICFEVTETAAVANLVRSAKLIAELRRMGFRFALDDFGSGMSSFAYLKRLPVDYLKIDGVFVRNVATDPVDASMVQAIANIAGVMGIATVAEYVESAEISGRLGELGVNFAQGYYIHKPEPLWGMGFRENAPN